VFADIFASALKMCVVVGLVIADIFADATRADAIGPPQWWAKIRY
jgi:hypothetical protein